MGNAYFRTPRNTIKEFINLLSILDQNPDASWQACLDNVQVAVEANPDLAPLPNDLLVSNQPTNSTAVTFSPGEPGDDELSTFRL